MRLLMLFALLVTGCNQCGPTANDFLGCAGSCGTKGVAEVTFTRCVCQGGKPDGGGR